MGWLSVISNSENRGGGTSVALRNISVRVRRESKDSEVSQNSNVFPQELRNGISAPFSVARPDTADEDLPLLEAAEVRNHKSHPDGKLWIVVDDVVYDCTEFASQHPGGAKVIENFRGEDCSWQFWRFHDQALMRDWGKQLRIGRTEGAKNRFREVPRYVGMRQLFMAADDD